MDHSREKDTIITIMVGFLVLYGIFPVKGFWIAALVVGLAGIISGKLAQWIHKTWFFFSEILGYMMSRIVLGTLFFVILLPIAFMAKLFRKDIMMLKRSYPSYFVDRNMEYQPKDLERPW